MVILASIYLRFYVKVGVGVGAFLPNPTPAKIPSDSDSTALAGRPRGFWLQPSIDDLNLAVSGICEIWGLLQQCC
jgi:hypothetical protein